MNAPRSGCPINLTLEALGDRWSLIVIRGLMFGNRRHFRELLTRSEERIPSNILADRLTRLVRMSRDEFFKTFFTGQKDLAVMAELGATERRRFREGRSRP